MAGRSQVLLFSLKEPVGDQWWNAIVRADLTVPIEEGDVLLLTAELKTNKPGTQDSRPAAHFYVTQTVGEEKTRVLGKEAMLSTEWQIFSFPFAAKKT